LIKKIKEISTEVAQKEEEKQETKEPGGEVSLENQF
jgi:hypothetical protein